MIAEVAQKSIKIRWIAVDVFKGWGIWYMFIIHAFIQQIAGYDGSLFINTIAQFESWWPYLFAVPVGIISLWGFMFGFAFACTVAMQTMRLVDVNPRQIPKYIFHKLIMGCLLLLLNKIGYLLFQIPFFTDGRTFFPELGVSYDASILDAIAWMGVLIPIMMSVLYGLFRIKRTNHLVFTLLILLTFWIALTPTLITYGESAVNWLNNHHLQIFSLLITKFTRGRFCLLPGLAYGFIGSIYATLMYHQSGIKKISRFMMIFFAYCMVLFILWIILVDPSWFQNFTNESVPIPLTIVSMSTMQFLFVLFIKTQDYPKNEAKRVKAAKRTTFWRRFSVFSLTGFSIGTPIADRIFSLFVYFWGPSVDYSSGTGIFVWNFFQIIIFVLFIWGFWELILRLWENFEYKFSLDWFLAQLMSMFTGAKMGRSDVQQIIYGPNKHQIPVFELLEHSIQVQN